MADGAPSLTKSAYNIQLGRNFGNDYESCLIKLDVVRLRFLRWGELITVVTRWRRLATSEISRIDEKRGNR